MFLSQEFGAQYKISTHTKLLVCEFILYKIESYFVGVLKYQTLFYIRSRVGCW